ncbi:hemerythrin [Catellatospora methionotrophica]|uniref:Hemerythrin n=1 Tax=Catellatospora methionotrophica TaxID=121620 RepID=A0A8J3L2Y3_9ACTN|nr:hemerythrin domain-containing protein [Catellatospora methionotrophica]GIG13602.1 hemerythrin [Catellatospora methionotrophica]
MTTAQQDVIDTLLGQHQQVKMLFAQVESADGAHRQELFTELVGTLALHENIEQLLVHPLAEQELPDGDQVVPPRLAEEADAKQALAELYELGVDHPEFDAKLAALRDAVSAHAEAEEELEFLRLREVSDPAELSRMAVVVARAQALLAEHAQAGSGQQPGPLAGPPDQVFDRLRDVLGKADGNGVRG